MIFFYYETNFKNLKTKQKKNLFGGLWWGGGGGGGGEMVGVGGG